MITPLDFMIAMFQTNQYYLFVLFWSQIHLSYDKNMKK